MAGIPKQKVYLYDCDGSYIQEFESISNFADYVGISQNIFSVGKKREVIELEDGRVACLDRIGKESVRQYKRYRSSPYTVEYAGRNISESRKNGQREVEVYTQDNEVVAVYKNSYFYKKMLGLISDPRIPTRYWDKDGLKVRYSKNDSDTCRR